MPKRIDNSARQIVKNVRAFCEAEKALGSPLIPLVHVRARVAAMTGISEKTVSLITVKGEMSEPKIRRKPSKRISMSADEISIVKQKIQEMYEINKELPSLKMILNEVKNDINFKGGRTTLWKILREFDIVYKKKDSKPRNQSVTLSAEHSQIGTKNPKMMVSDVKKRQDISNEQNKASGKNKTGEKSEVVLSTSKYPMEYLQVQYMDDDLNGKEDLRMASANIITNII